MRNASEHVLEQVTALANQSAVGIDFEVIWVDNGSTDGTAELVTKSIRGDQRMQVVSAPEVRSSYFARNRGAALAQADLLLFCDADDVADERWVQSMATALKDMDVVGGSLMLDSDTPAMTAGVFFGFLPAAPTANLGFRRDAFAELGGFNAEIPSGDDIAMCWRAQLQGFRFGFAPDAVVLHRRRPTEWTRAQRIWAQGKSYRDWVLPFVALGAEAPTVGAALRRIVERALIPAIKKPQRDHARVVLWNLAVIFSSFVRPKPRSA